MKKLLIVFIILALVGAGAYVLTQRTPGIDPEDFVNEVEVIREGSLTDEQVTQLEQDLQTRYIPSEEDIDEKYDEAQAYFNGGLYSRALEKIEALEFDFRPDARTLELKGDILVSMRQYKSAAEIYNLALELDNDRSSVYLDVADLYLMHSNQQKKSIRFYERARDLVSGELKAELEEKIEALKNSF